MSKNQTDRSNRGFVRVEASLPPRSGSKLTLIRRQPVPRVVVGKHVHPQHLAQEFTPRVDVPEIFRIGVAVEDRRRAVPERPSGHAHFELFGGAYLRRGGRGGRLVVIAVVSPAAAARVVAVASAIGMRVAAPAAVAFARERRPHPLPSLVLGALDEERGDALAEGVREPYDL